MTNAEVLRVFSEYEACEDLSEWAKEHGGSLKDLWRDCQDGELMLWLAVEAGLDRRTVVRAACACARTALQYVPVGEERPRRALELAEAWARGEETLEAVRTAADAADYAAADATYADAAAAEAATSAYFAATAANAYAANVVAAYTAVVNAASAAFFGSDGGKLACAQTLADCAELVRAYISAADSETVALKGRTS